MRALQQAVMSRTLPGPVWSSEMDCGWINPLRGQRLGYYQGGFITGTVSGRRLYLFVISHPG